MKEEAIGSSTEMPSWMFIWPRAIIYFLESYEDEHTDSDKVASRFRKYAF